MIKKEFILYKILKNRVVFIINHLISYNFYTKLVLYGCKQTLVTKSNIKIPTDIQFGFRHSPAQRDSVRGRHRGEGKSPRQCSANRSQQQSEGFIQ